MCADGSAGQETVDPVGERHGGGIRGGFGCRAFLPGAAGEDAGGAGCCTGGNCGSCRRSVDADWSFLANGLGRVLKKALRTLRL